jgi:hypothetical protein
MCCPRPEDCADPDCSHHTDQKLRKDPEGRKKVELESIKPVFQGSQTPRTVISLTTIPGRYDRLRHTLKYLREQDYPVAAIYLTLPWISRRFNAPYPELPADIAEQVTVVRVDQDYGPICKIVGALLREPDPQTLIVTVDDDIVYSPNLVSSLVLESQKHPKAGISGSGIFLSGGVMAYSYHCHSAYDSNFFLDFQIPDTGRPVEILCGFSGVLYPRSAFPNAGATEPTLEHHLVPLLKWVQHSEEIFLNDDVLLSAWLSSEGYQRIVINNTPKADTIRWANKEPHPHLDNMALSYNLRVFVQRILIAYQQLMTLKLFKEQLECNTLETVGVKVFAIVILVILLILCVCALCWYNRDSWKFARNSTTDDISSMMLMKDQLNSDTTIMGESFGF